MEARLLFLALFFSGAFGTQSFFYPIPNNGTTNIPNNTFTTPPDITTTTIPNNPTPNIPNNTFTSPPDITTTTIPNNPTPNIPNNATTTTPDSTTTSLTNFANTNDTLTMATTGRPTTTLTNNQTGAPPTALPTPTFFSPTCPPLHNGLDGVCICDEEFIGETCQIPNVCNGSILEEFHSIDLVGWFGYGKQLCDSETHNAGIPRASVRCVNNSGVHSYQKFQKFNCSLTLDEVQQNITGNLMEAATSTMLLTSKPQQLTTDSITKAVEIVTQLLAFSNNEEVSVAALTTISQLLYANFTAGGGTVDSNTTNRLTSTLEHFSISQENNMHLGMHPSLMIQPNMLVLPNLVVQSVRGLDRASQGVAFSALTGLSGNFVANGIQLNPNASHIDDSGPRDSDMQIFVRLQPGLSRAKTRVGFVLYQNDRLFQSKRFRTPRGTTRRVISASVSSRKMLVGVEMHFKPTNISGAKLHDFACVFWDYTLGDWSTAGCTKHRNPSSSLGCFCNHTTNFAVLMSFRNNIHYAKDLEFISILGCSLSIAGVTITIIFQILTRKARKGNTTLLQVNICVSLLLFYLLFLFGINNKAPAAEEANVPLHSDQHEEWDHGGCTAITVLLHYFLLATFSWNSLYATSIFLLIHRPFSQHHRHFTTLVVGWGLPAVIVALTLGIAYRKDHFDYRQEEFCWLAALNKEDNVDMRKPMLWGFLIPVALMLFFNSMVLAYFTVVTCRTNQELRSTKTHSSKKKLLSSFSLGVILGLSWILGYLLLTADNEKHYILSIVFCVLNTTQGLQIFILFTVRTSMFRKKVSELLNSVPVPQIYLCHQKFSLWRRLSEKNMNESYTPTEPQSTSQF